MENQIQHKDSFYFILNPVEFDFETPQEVINGHFLRRPTDDEVEIIRKNLRLLTPVHGRFGPLNFPHEEGLEREKWKYAIISFKGINSQQQIIADCLGLLNPPMELGLTVTYHYSTMGVAEGVGFNSLSFSSYLNSTERLNEKVLRFTRQSLAEMPTICGLISRAMAADDVEAKCVISFRNIKFLPRMSDATVLLSFAVIESLITHKPKLAENFDSIKHQVASKMILLNKRFKSPCEGSKYFNMTAISPKPNEVQKKMWSLLYDFRSAVAHGQGINMKGELGKLMSSDAVCEFISENLRQLLLYSLEDPDFMRDFRSV